MTTLVRAEPEQVLARLGIIALALAAATAAAAALQAWLGIADASAIYLLAVVVDRRPLRDVVRGRRPRWRPS